MKDSCGLAESAIEKGESEDDRWKFVGKPRNKTFLCAAG